MSHDFDDMSNFNIVDFAKQILTMNSKLINQAMEVERLRGFEKKYNDLMNDSLKHSQTMVGNTIKMLLDPVEPQPPVEHIRHAGHHWLQQRAVDGNTFELVVLQWNPVQKRWFISGCVGAAVKPINTMFWKYVTPCPLPPV